MSETIRRELLIPQPREQVWRALADSAALAEWMYPNDFEPRVGHHFTFQVPPNPKAGFDGLVVRCEVLACEPPDQLAFSWSAGGLEGTQNSEQKSGHFRPQDPVQRGSGDRCAGSGLESLSP